MSETLAAAQKRVSPEFSNSLNVEGALEDSTPTLTLTADQGDDAGDRWQVKNGGNTAGLSVNNDFGTKETFGLNCLNLGNVSSAVINAVGQTYETATTGEVTTQSVHNLVVGDRVVLEGAGTTLETLFTAARMNVALFVKSTSTDKKFILSATSGGDAITTVAQTAVAFGTDHGEIKKLSNTATVGFGASSDTNVAGNLLGGRKLINNETAIAASATAVNRTVHMIDGTDDLTVTLPTPVDGNVIKFVVTTAVGNSKIVKIKSPSNYTKTSYVHLHKTKGAIAQLGLVADGTSHVELHIKGVSNAGGGVGSVVTCTAVLDANGTTSWLLEGNLVLQGTGAEADTSVFA